MIRKLFLALTSSAVSAPDSPVCYSTNLSRLILPLSCIYGSLLHLSRVDVKCCQIGGVIYIPEWNFILIPVDGLDIVGPEQQSPDSAAFSERSVCLQYAVWCPNRRLSASPLIKLAAGSGYSIVFPVVDKVSWVGHAQYFISNWKLALNM